MQQRMKQPSSPLFLATPLDPQHDCPRTLLRLYSLRRGVHIISGALFYLSDGRIASGLAESKDQEGGRGQLAQESSDFNEKSDI